MFYTHQNQIKSKKQKQKQGGNPFFLLTAAPMPADCCSSYPL